MADIGIKDGYLYLPTSTGLIGFPLWFVAVAISVVVGLVVVAALTLVAMSSKRRENR